MSSNIIAVARQEADELRQWLRGSEHAAAFARWEGLQHANLREIRGPLAGHPAAERILILERLIAELEEIAAAETAAKRRQAAKPGPKARPAIVTPPAAA